MTHLLAYDLSAAQACQVLGVKQAWLRRHRHLLRCRLMPGRGRTRQEWRYDRVSVLQFRAQGFAEAHEAQADLTLGQPIAEIIRIVKSRSAARP